MNRESRRNRRKLVEIWKFRPAWMRVVAGLAAVVMFVTVYSLILPAAAATGDQATEESGFFLEESTAETETKELAEAEPASGGEAAQEAESPSGSSEEGSTVQQESGSSAQPETLQAETSGSGSGWESIPQDKAAPVEAANGNTDNVSSAASGSGQNGTEEFVVSEQETNKSTEAAVTEETVSETASQETNATTEEITEETSEELSDETEEEEEEEEEPVYTNTIETEDEKTGIKAKIVFDEEIVCDTDKLVLAAASDKKSDKEIVIPLDALEKGIAERCAEIVNKDLDDEEKKSADDIETVKAEFVGLTIEDKDGEEVSLPANTRMQVEIVFPGSYETEDEEYQCVLMAEQSAKDYQDQLEKKAADDELVVSMEKLKADVSEQDQAYGGKTVVSFETKELNSAGVVVFRVIEDDVEEASSDESEVSEESSETSEESSDESTETSEEVTDESSEETSESKEPVSEDALAEVPAESTDEVTSESEEAASEEDETVYEAGTLKADGGDYHITMSYAEDAKIPAGARLEVRELQERTREFNKLIGQYNKEFPDAKVETESSSAVVRGLKKAGDAVTGFIGGLLGIEKAPEPTSVQTARLFDITIFDENGKEIEPSGTVQVDIQLDALQQVAKESDVTLVHFEDKVNEVDASLSGETLSFETDSFSVYGVMYTVDFEYTDPESGETYYYSIEGGSSVALSELVEVLGMLDGTRYENTEAFLADVENVTFSDESLVKVLKNDEGNDWALESLQPFETKETLTIAKRDGEIIKINVFDDQTTGVWDLADTDNTKSLRVSADASVTTTEQERDGSFKLTFTYSLEEDVVRAIDAYDKPFSLEYDLSSVIATSPLEIRNNSNGVISIGSRRLGTYKVVNGKVTLNFTDPSYFDGRSSFTGFFNLTAQTNESELGVNDEYTYTFPGTGDTIPIKYKKILENTNKTLNAEPDADGNYTLHYTATVDVTSNLDSLTFNDTIGGLQTLDSSSVKIGGKSVSVTQTEKGFTFDVASALGTTGVAKGSYQVTYDTKLTAEQLKNMTTDKTTETNAVSWKVNGTTDIDGKSTTKDFEKPKEPIPVVKTISDTTSQPGEVVNYTITFGKDTTALSGFHISDVMTDVVIPQGKVTLTYNGQSQDIDFGAQSTDSNYSKGSVTLFDYTFPEGTAGNGPVTATYSVKLIDADTAKANGLYDTTEVSNTAIEHRQNTNDTKKTTVTYEKEPVYTVTKSETSNKTGDGKWAPGTVISYTLTIGDANTNMAGVNIKDVMTDLQVLQGDVMIKVGNGNTMKLADYVADAMKWVDDGNYSTNDVELFNFNMPSNAGNGPVVITYTTKVITQAQATAASIYGDKTIKNTGSGGKQSDGTEGIGEFKEFPVTKDVTQNGASVNGQTVEMGSTVHYVLTYGEAGMNLAGVVIEDYMTDLQKLAGEITVKKSDGTTFTMPQGTGQYSEDGNNWSFWDDSKYDPNQRICLFKYRLPSNIGEGPITIEYDAQIITEDEAKESGINGTQSAFNKFINPETEVKIDFPKEVPHNPQVRKEFDHWDVENSKVYWNIIVEKDAESAYPLENVSVREAWDRNQVVISGGLQPYRNTFDGTFFDSVNAVVTTDDGTELTPGVDYTIDAENTMFTFPVLNERVHINLSFKSPSKITDGFTMKNKVRLNNDKEAEAEETYNNPKIEAIKNGTYTESDRLIKWEVILNPASLRYTKEIEGDPVWFTDQIPSGLTIVNYNTKSTSDPSVNVSYYNRQDQAGWNIYMENIEKSVSLGENNTITGDISHSGFWGNKYVGLDGEKIVVQYYTLLSDEEWNEITSSASGSETFKNHVTITTPGGDSFDAVDSVVVTSDGYLKKTDTTPKDGSSGIVIDPETDENSKNITYRVEINPNGYVLNSGKVLSLTDYIATNMDLDPSTVVLKHAHKEGNNLVPDGDATGISVSYNDDSRMLHIQDIPDSTPLLLTYTCIARAQGTDTFTNTATLIGGGSHSSTDTKEHKIQTDEAGVSVDGIALYLYKIDENNVTKPLPGAQFQLYECKLAIGDLTGKDQQYWNDLLAQMDRITRGGGSDEEIAEIKEQFAITDYAEVEGPQTSGQNGRIRGWESLSEHKLYAWKEVTTPDHYTGSSEYHYFVGYQFMNVNTESGIPERLPEQEQTNRKNAAWALDDATQLANGIRVASMASYTTWTATNVEDIYTSISATKEWEGDSDNKFETRPTGGIKLQLVRINADGSREDVGDPVAINADKDGNWPTYIWNKLPAKDADGNKLKYTVVEERVDDYTTEYSDGGEGIEFGEITVTNKLLPKNTNIYVEKAFDQEGDEKPSEIHITLMIIKTDKDGNVSEPEEYLEYELNELNEWKHVFEKLPTKEVDDDGNAYYLTYTVVEDLAAIERQGFKYTVTYSDDGKGVLETTAEEPLKITNTAPRNGSLKINKVVKVNGVDPTADTYPLVNGTYTFTITKKDDTEFAPRTVELDINGNSSAESEEIKDLPAGTYVITENPVTGTELISATIDDTPASVSSNSVEVEVVAGKAGTASPVVAFTNNVTKIEFEKQWKNNNESIKWADNTSITVTVSSGDLVEYTYTIAKTDLTVGTEVSGQPEGAPKLIVKTVSEDDSAKKYEYKFEVKGLPYNNGVAYKVTEEQVDKYNEPQYKTNGQDTDGAMDGGAIINIAQESYALPSTGGRGTALFTILGSILTLGAGIMLFRRRMRFV